MKLILLFLFVSAGIQGQDTTERKEFEVVSIKPSGPPAAGQFNFGLHIDRAQVRCTYCSLKDLVVMAYKLKFYQFSGPDWMTSQRFDLSAKLPEGAKRSDVLPMLQSMLLERFQLKTHHGSKEFSVYALVVAKGGLKMKESAAAADSSQPIESTDVEVSAGRGSSTTVDLGNGSSLSFGDNKLEATKVMMTVLADQLGRFLDRPVVDMTDLRGAYDFALEFPPEEFLVMKIRTALSAGVEMPPQAIRLLENASDGPLLNAVQTLGLKLESRKTPLEIVVVDSALKVPIESQE